MARGPPRRRYARASALDSGESCWAGCAARHARPRLGGGATRPGDRLVALSDLWSGCLIRKIRRRRRAPALPHADGPPLRVIALVLNQGDLLTPGQADHCVDDLQRLLEAEGLHDIQVLVTSATTGAGIDRAAPAAGRDRLGAPARRPDLRRRGRVRGPVRALRQGAGRWAREPDGQDGEGKPPAVASRSADHLAASRAAGVRGVGHALQSACELRAVDFVGWPVARSPTG